MLIVSFKFLNSYLTSVRQKYPYGSVMVDFNRSKLITLKRARCSSVVRVFAHVAMSRWIDRSWSGPIELFLVPASAARLV